MIRIFEIGRRDGLFFKMEEEEEEEGRKEGRGREGAHSNSIRG